MKRYISSENSPFSTFEVNGVSSQVLGVHMYITQKSEREQIADGVFDFMNTVYDEAGLGGFKSFKDIQHFIDDPLRCFRSVYVFCITFRINRYCKTASHKHHRDLECVI